MLNKRVSVTTFVVTAFALFGGVVAQAANGTWNSTGAGSTASWTNSLNWSASPYPSGADTATFNNSGNSRTTIDLTGLVSVANITFDTASAAAYSVGAGAANSQTLIMGDNGTFRMNSGVATGQTFNATVQLGPNTASASYTLQNDAPGQTLTLNNISGTTGGTKTLNLNGSGPITLLGSLDKKNGTLNVNLNSTGALTLSGNNSLHQLQINGANCVISLAAGTITYLGNGGGNGIMSAQNCTINGPGALSLSTGGGENFADNGAAIGTTLTINAKLTGATGFEYYHASYYGTIIFAGTNDYTQNTIMNSPGTIGCYRIGNKGSTTSNLGQGTTFIHHGITSRLLYLGTGETTDRTIDMRTSGSIEQGGSGILNFTDPISATSGTNTLTLQGSTAGTGEFSGPLRDGVGKLSIIKAGTGTWTLSSTNTYTGATAVNGGTLALSGTLGSLSASSGITLSSATTLILTNSAAANNTDRIGNTSPLSLNGSTLSFAHAGDAVNYSETLGMVTLSQGVNTIAASPADDGQTSTLTLSLTRATGATVNFSGTGLGTNARNRIFIAGQADGLIGTWATVNGTRFAAYSSTLGVYAADIAYSDEIAARGPSVIPNNAAADVSISSPGDSGPITLAGAWTNSVHFLFQNTTTNATVATRDGATNKTLLASALVISDGQADLMIGENAGDGFLSALVPGGVLTLGNANAAGQLTVKAAVTDNATASSLLKTGPGPVTLSGPLGYTGPTTLADGTLALDVASTQTLVSVVSGPGSLTKVGAGRLVLSGANTYSGATLISAGVVAPSNNTAFGTLDAGTTIASGATLDVGSSTNGLLALPETFTVSGTGAGGSGVIVNTGAQQLNAFGKVILAGDATFGGTGRWDLRNNNATLTLNGHTLTKAGTNVITLVNTAVNPNTASATGRIDVTSGTFSLEAGTTLGGTIDNTLTFRTGTMLTLYNLAAASAPVWSLVLDPNSIVAATQGSAPLNAWAGPVTLNGNVTLAGNNGGYSETFSGPVSGSGSLYKTDVAVAYLTGTNNTYAGVTVVSNGTLYAYNPGSLSGYGTAGKVTVLGNATLCVRPGDGATGWNASQLDALRTAATFTANTAMLGIDTTPTNFVYAGNISQALSLTKFGTGTLTLAGTNTYTGTTRVYGGELALGAGSSNSVAAVNVQGGAAGATLSVNGPLLTTVGGNNALTAGVNASDRGMVNVASDVTTYNINLANLAAANGALYQSAGNVKVSNYLGIGAAGGYGYYRITGGTLTVNSYLEVGTYGNAVMDVLGGTVNANGTFDINRRANAAATLNVYGGLVNAPSNSQMQMGRELGPVARLNVFGGTVNAANGTGTTKIFDMNAGTGAGGATAINLKSGGTLIANKISATQSGQTVFDFDGGTLQVAPASTVGATFLQGLAAAVVYPGGAVIDTTNVNIRLNQPLLAPTGYGVSAIPLRSNGAGYIGAPVVNISGGTGTGATAIATVDLATNSATYGQVTALQVTSPGFGYQAADTVTVTLAGGGYTTAAVTNSYALAANSPAGGLTKLGSGILILGGTNTYGGATTISNGTVNLGVANALPTNATVRVAGGIYDLGGFTVTNGSVTVTAGIIRNGTLVAGAVTKTDSGTVVLTANLASSVPIGIGSGTLQLKSEVGLYEGAVSGDFNITDPNPKSQVLLTTRMANTTAGWTDHTTYIYSGYIWNRASTNVTWTFGENFDDSVLLKIDGNTLLNNGVWNAPTYANYTLTPGGHAFDARFGQGSGGVGPNSAGWWTSTTMGFGVDFLGRNASVSGNYQPLTDPGDGSLLTPTANGNSSNVLSVASSVQVAAGAALDLGGTVQTLTGLSGGGIVSNGTLSVTGTIAPGGTNVIGTLTVKANLTGTATLLADVAMDGVGDLLAVQGNVNLSGMTLTIANPGQLDHSKQYTVLTCTGTRSGTFNSVTVPDSRWHVLYQTDGTVKLAYVNGTMIQLL